MILKSGVANKNEHFPVSADMGKKGDKMECFYGEI